jgi:anti-sigma factor RsiW
MKCNRVRKDLSAYIDGEVSSRRRTAIENHLAVCPDCRQYKESLSRVAESVREVDRIEPSAEFWSATMRRIRTLVKVPGSLPAVTPKWAPALVASLVVAICVAGWLAWSANRAARGPTDEEMFTRVAIVAELAELMKAETIEEGSAEIWSILYRTEADNGGMAVEDVVTTLSSSEQNELRTVLLEMVKEG